MYLIISARFLLLTHSGVKYLVPGYLSLRYGYTGARASTCALFPAVAMWRHIVSGQCNLKLWYQPKVCPAVEMWKYTCLSVSFCVCSAIHILPVSRSARVRVCYGQRKLECVVVPVMLCVYVIHHVVTTMEGVCACVVCLCMYACLCTYLYVPTFICVCVSLLICLLVYVSVYVFVYLSDYFTMRSDHFGN